MNILDILFPRRCLFCLKSGNYICNNCLRQFQPSLPECFYCRRLSNYYKSHTDCNNLFVGNSKNASTSVLNNEPNITFATYLFRYNEAAKVLMKEAKFNGSFDVFRNLEMLIKYGLERTPLFLEKNAEYMLVPVPQHRRRFMRRGFDHTELIAEAFEELLLERGFKVSVEEKIVMKKVNNKRQASLSKKNRLDNAKGVYEVEAALLEGASRIVLIDDVITTGSTLESVAKEIKTVSQNIEINVIALFRGKASFKDGV